jgi:hypothetical protein
VAENRASNVAGIRVTARTRASAGISAASRRTSDGPSSAKRAAGRSTWQTWPVACTPASVRPATVSPSGVSTPTSRVNASVRTPATVRRPGCAAHPEKSVPSYEMSSRTRIEPPSPDGESAASPTTVPSLPSPVTSLDARI